MADVSKLNGYEIKDAAARQSIEELREEINNIEPPEIDTDNLVTKEELREELENLDLSGVDIDTSQLATKEELNEFKESLSRVFVDPQEANESFEGIDIFSIADATVLKPDGNPATYYRIPALTVTAKNTLVAFTDVRYDTAADNSGRISIYCRRSEDKGATWGPAIEVCKFPTGEDGVSAYAENSRSMDSTVIATKSGKLFCLNGAWKSNWGNWSQVALTPDPDWCLKLSVSEDDGKSWVTYNLNERPDMCTGIPSDLVSMLGGVGQGIQMYDGTLAFPVQLTRRPNGQRTVCATIMYSKDDGATWKIAEGFAPAGDGEDNIVEISPGVIFMNARGGNARPCFITKDMGKTWSSHEMSGKIGNGGVGCQGSSTKVCIDGKEVFLHSSPINHHSDYSRDSITLYASYDWKNYELLRTYYPPQGDYAGAGYSCLAPAVIDGQLCLFCLYERQGNIAFRNLGMDLEKVVEKVQTYYQAEDRDFEVCKSDLVKLLEKFSSSELVLFNMLDHYLNNLSSAERNLIETQMVKLAGVDSKGQVVDRGGATWQINGDIESKGNIYYFKGEPNTYIKTKGLNLVENYTVDFDVYISGTTDTNWNWLFSLDNESTPGCGLAINESNVWNPAFDWNGSYTYTDPDATFLGKWIHITVTKSATEGAKVYHDCVLKFSNASFTHHTGDYQNFTIGNHSTASKKFHGKIANFKIYNKIVTEEEMQYLFENRKHTDVFTYELPKFASSVPEGLQDSLICNIGGFKIGEFGESMLYDEGGHVWTVNGETEYVLNDNRFVFNNRSDNYVRTANFLDINFTVDFDIFINSAPGTNWTQVFCIGPDYGTPGFALAINGTSTWNPATDGNGGPTYEDPSGSFVGKWIHITAVKSSENGCSFYHNGELLWNSQANASVEGTGSVSSYPFFAIGNNTNPVKQFNGEIANFRVYDRVLTEEEIRAIGAKAGETIIREGYSPNGASFSDTVEIDFNTEELDISMDLTNCSRADGECVISIGANIGSWAGNNIHFYYYPNTDYMKIQCMQGGSAQNIELNNITGRFSVKFSSEGLIINGTLYEAANYATFRNISVLTSVQVGSTEGAGRSQATNYTIKKVQK